MTSDANGFNGRPGHNGGPPMYEDSGWVAISRASRTHPVVGWHLFVEPVDPNRGALQPALAWYDLIMECRYMDGTVNNNGRIMILRRGNTLGANAWLASRWNWSVKTVKGFLERLERHGMITRHGGEEASTDQKNPPPSLSQSSANDAPNRGQLPGRSRGRFANVISVCNYDAYQMPVRPQGLVEGPVDDPSKGRLRAGSGPVQGRLENDLHIIARDTAHAHARPNKDNKGTKEQNNQSIGDTTRDLDRPIDLRSLMIDKIEPNMGLQGDPGRRKRAEQWLATTIQQYGTDVTTRAFQVILEMEGRGEVIGRLLPCWTTNAQRLKESVAKRASAAGSDLTPEEQRRLARYRGEAR